MKTKTSLLCAVVALLSGRMVRAAADYPLATWNPAVAGNYGVASRTSSDVRWVIIHTTEGTTASAVARFQDPTQVVSAHYIISRDGTIIQMVRDQDVAYAAGNLAYNNAAINIEHERYDTYDCTPVQLAASAALVKWLAQRYNVAIAFPGVPTGIAPANPADGSGIIGHIQVPDPNNPALGGGASHHTDPVNWDWAFYETLFNDTTPPTLVIDFPPDGSVTTSPSITVTGAASDSGQGNNGVSSVTVNGNPTIGGTANGTATANWSATVPLNSGPNTITVVATDGLGNQAQRQISITYNAPEALPPTLVLDFPPDGSVTSSSSLTVTGGASDAGQGNDGISSVTVNGVAAAGGTATGAATANWSATITLSPGANTITVVAKDTLNNATQKQITVTYSPTSTRTLTITSVNPATSVPMTVTPSDNGGVSTGVTPLTLTYNQNTVVTVQAALTVNGLPFRKFQLDGVDTNTFLDTVTMDKDHTLTAVYGSLPAQTLTFPALPNRSLGEPPFALVATASSGLPVTFFVISGPAATSGSLGNILTVTNTGTVVVLAQQNGNLDYDPSPTVLQSFTVYPPPVLEFARHANTLVLAWSTNVDGYALESVSSLVAPLSWSPVSPVFLYNGEFTTTNPVTAGPRFYRLRK